jgi:4-aminobutyrate aminotransferase / (S)-3-amino-2-methylpropionate transaminase / 5-aminovalerate transaminase
MAASMQWPPVSGNQPPLVDKPRTQSGLWAERALAVNAPMGPMCGQSTPDLVYERAFGANVFDADGNRYVDLAAGFGAILLGHCHPELTAAIADQALQLTQALGDVFPSTQKIALQEQLAERFGGPSWRVILGQSGADAITAALKTAMLATGRAGVIAFSGAYHGLSYAPLALCQLRESYRRPFGDQLNPNVHVVPYPGTVEQGERSLAEAEVYLSTGEVGAVVIEPILGRGGCIVPPDGFLSQLVHLTQGHGALSIFDEIWTGLGRCGSFCYAETLGLFPDILCLGKGLGGGLPISACIGKNEVMQAWQRDDEVVHTSTFAGAPLAAAAANRLLTILDRDKLVDRSLGLGDAWIVWLRNRLGRLPAVKEIRGRGLMVGIDLGPRPGIAAKVAKSLLYRGWIGSTGGGTREVLVLTPPLTIAESLLKLAADALYETLSEV